MRSLVLIDERILALFTKFSHWFQRLTGKTNFFLARLCLAPFAIGLLSFVLSSWLPLLPIPMPNIVSVVWILILSLIFVPVHSTHEAEKSFEKDPSTVPRASLSEQACSPFDRVFCLLTAPSYSLMGFLMWLETQQGILLLAVNCGATFGYFSAFRYFMLVKPFPPGKSKIRQWIEEFQAGFGKRQPLPSENR